MRARHICILAAALLTAACGFRPLYGEQSVPGGVAPQLASVAVGAMPDRAGYDLRLELESVLNPRGLQTEPRYDLDVRLAKRREGLAIAPDASITRYNVVFEAGFVLKPRSGGEPFSGTARTISAFNVVDSQFATMVAERDADARAIREIAQDIASRLAVHFERRAAEPASGAGPVPAP